MSFAVVVAADEEGGIGRAGVLPWQLPGDLAHFRRLTTETRVPGRRNAVVMGRRTWDSLPPRFRPLPGRLNVVVSRQVGFAPGGGARVAHGLDEALALAAADPDVEGIFVIGGGELYRVALAHPRCASVHLTRVEGRHGCDVFAPPLGPELALVARSPRREEGGVGYAIERWERTTAR